MILKMLRMKRRGNGSVSKMKDLVYIGILIFSYKEYSKMEANICAMGAEKTLPAQFWYF